MEVTSNKTISFSRIGWGINQGETRKLPEDKEAQKVILSHPAISEVGTKTKGRQSTESDKESK